MKHFMNIPGSPNEPGENDNVQPEQPFCQSLLAIFSIHLLHSVDSADFNAHFHPRNLGDCACSHIVQMARVCTKKNVAVARKLNMQIHNLEA
jgi:hypothetical protein